MNIGDKVRFLSEVGGGRICGFQGKDIVLRLFCFVHKTMFHIFIF